MADIEFGTWEVRRVNQLPNSIIRVDPTGIRFGAWNRRLNRALVFVSIEKLYQTMEIVFYRLSKHLEFHQKYPAARRIFNSFSRCLDIPMKHCLSCFIYYVNKQSNSKQKLPEQPIIIACIIAELIWKNSQFFTKFQRSGIPFLTSLSSFPNFNKNC